VKRHTAKVVGCGFYSLLATLYTISKDKTLVVTDITKTVNFALEGFFFPLHYFCENKLIRKNLPQ
jgi:hypothetical protein